MYCDQCGNKLSAPSRFCSNCGRALGTIALAPRQGRIADHVRLVGIMWLAASAFRLIPALVLLAMSWSRIFPPDVPEFVHGIFAVIGGFFLVAPSRAESRVGAC
jgi:hypothetical protein